MCCEASKSFTSSCYVSSNYYLLLINLICCAAIEISPAEQLTDYLQYLNEPTYNATLEDIVRMKWFEKLVPLFNCLLCTPATSDPVERIFSQSGLIIRPHRARLSDELLQTLVFLSAMPNSNIISNSNSRWTCMVGEKLTMINLTGRHYELTWTLKQFSEVTYW